MSKTDKLKELKRRLNPEAHPQAYSRLWAVFGDQKKLLASKPIDGCNHTDIHFLYQSEQAFNLATEH